MVEWIVLSSYPLLCGQDWWCKLPKKGQQAIGHISYAIAPFKVVLRIITAQCASESTSESHSSGEVEVKSQERCSGLKSSSTFNVYEYPIASPLNLDIESTRIYPVLVF